MVKQPGLFFSFADTLKTEILISVRDTFLFKPTCFFSRLKKKKERKPFYHCTSTGLGQYSQQWAGITLMEVSQFTRGTNQKLRSELAKRNRASCIYPVISDAQLVLGIQVYSIHDHASDLVKVLLFWMFVSGNHSVSLSQLLPLSCSWT